MVKHAAGQCAIGKPVVHKAQYLLAEEQFMLVAICGIILAAIAKSCEIEMSEFLWTRRIYWKKNTIKLMKLYDLARTVRFCLTSFVSLVGIGAFAQGDTELITNIDWNTASDEQVILQAIEETTPIPANNVPTAGTFYSAQHSPLSSSPWPPLPANVNNLSSWDLGSNVWLLDDTGFDYSAPVIQAGTMMAMDAGAPIPGISGGGVTNADNPAGNLFTFSPGTNLWIAQETVLSNTFTGILSNTVSDAEYQLLSANSLNCTQWMSDGFVLGSETTNCTPWSLPFTPTNNVFLDAVSWQDDTGTGIPDWWWLKYYGQDTNVDPYLDPTGDGWTLLQDFQNGWVPTNWVTPPAPQGLTVVYNSSNNTASLSWLSSPGAVLGYTVQRQVVYFDDQGEENFSVGTTNLLDNDVPPPSLIGLASTGPSPVVYYQVQANYSGGNSAWSSTVYAENYNNSQSYYYSFSANLVENSQGNVYVEVSSLPANTAALHVTRINTYESNAGNSSFNTNFDIPASSSTNGLYPIANYFAQGEESGSGFGIPDNLTENYEWWVQAISTNGVLSPAVLISGGYTPFADGGTTNDWLTAPYYDGRAQLKQNLIFLLCEPNENAPFNYASPGGIVTEPSTYAYASYYNTGPIWNGYAMTPTDHSLNVFRPFEENYLYSNFVPSPANVDFTGNLDTGASEALDPNTDLYTTLTLSDPATNQFQAPISLGITIPTQLTGAQWLASFPFEAAFGFDVTNIDGTYYFLDLNPIGITYWSLTEDDTEFIMTANARNYFGLTFGTAKLEYYNLSGNLQTDTLSPGGSDTTHFGPIYVYSQTAQPELQTVEYDFWNPATDSLPGDDNFSPTNASHTFTIVPAGTSVDVAGYAKMAVTNGYSGVFGYLGQYFDQAYQIDTNGNVTTNSAGIVSPYGQFFANQPGPAALVTMPDPDTGARGTDIVYVVKLQLDVNHDGIMDLSSTGPDVTSLGSPMEFWINNDNDGTGLGVEKNAAESPDSANETIQSMRDLEDFARLWICGLPVLPANYQVTLSWTNITSGNPSIKIFASHELNGGTGYLTDTNIAQYYVGDPLSDSTYGTVTNGQNFRFPDLYFTEGGDKHLIFEGVTAGAGELVMTITDNKGNQVAQTGAWLDLHDIKDFYELAEGTNVTSGLPPSSLVSQLNVVRTIPVAQNETKEIIVFVHGINNTFFDAQSSAETLYKRLYWSGYHGRVAEFKWPCAFLPFDNTLNPFNYNLGEFYAWKSASALMDYLTYLRNRPDLAGYDIDILAHSQGNVVASEAVRLGAPFDNYILTQGAIPAHCYDASVPFLQSLLAAETNGPTPFYTTNGGYNGYFSGVTGNLVNFYNTNDYALATGTWNGLQANWVADQISQKPENYTYRLGQDYEYSPISFRSIAFYTADQYDVTDPYEIMSQVARSRSSAVGAQANVGGVIDSADSVDLVAEFGFGNTRAEHSAEFTRPIQAVWGYYDAVLTAFKLQHVDR